MCMASILYPRRRKLAFCALLAVSAYVIIGLPLLKLGVEVRRHAFRDLADRGSVLAKAIEQYQRMQGTPPAALEDLLPVYISEIPSTRMPAYGPWEYEVGKPGEWDGNPWVIYLYCSSGVLNWDMFLYFPLQNYPDEGYGGTLERLGDWAYVHE